MNDFYVKHRRTLQLTAAFVSLGIAVLYLFISPGTSSDISGSQYFVFEYAHSICWLFIAAFFIALRFNANKMFRTFLLFTALASYLGFLILLVSHS